MPTIKRKSKSDGLKSAASQPFVEEDDPFEYQVEKPYKVYNPRRMQWEWSDTGLPCETVPGESRKERTTKRTNSTGEVVFKRGKYADIPLDKVPTWYLRNFVDNADYQGSAIYQEAEDELRKRTD